MLKYETIAQDIQSRIEDGDLVPNDKLPTVVDLCDRYGVSKITVKRAFEILTEKGLIASKRGSGTYVKNITELFDTGASTRCSGARTARGRTRSGSPGPTSRSASPPRTARAGGA